MIWDWILLNTELAVSAFLICIAATIVISIVQRFKK
jgi:hypothetical protein